MHGAPPFGRTRANAGSVLECSRFSSLGRQALEDPMPLEQFVALALVLTWLWAFSH